MNISVAVKHMLAAGMPADAIVAAVEEMEACIAPSRSKAAERQARYRERNKASQSVTNHNEALHVTNKEVFPRTPFQETPLSKENPPKGGQKKGSRLNSEWQPSAENLEYAKAQGLNPAETNKSAANFRDYWIAKPGQGGVKVDWDATWRTWVRREAERLGRKPQDAAPQGPNWKLRAETWAETGNWSDMWGPPPDSPDFAPPDNFRHLFKIRETT